MLCQFCVYRWFYDRSHPLNQIAAVRLPSPGPWPEEGITARVDPTLIPSGEIVASLMRYHAHLCIAAAVAKYGMNYHPFRENEFASTRAEPSTTAKSGTTSISSTRPDPVSQHIIQQMPITTVDPTPITVRTPPKVAVTYLKRQKRVQFDGLDQLDISDDLDSLSVADHRPVSRKGWKGWVALGDGVVKTADKSVDTVTLFETRRTRSGRTRP
jgi:hypothetical protein